VSKGSLRQNLPDVAQMAWKDKLNVLYSIVSDLESIHSQELVHRDLHSGNILQDHLHSAYITDLGLSISSDIKQKEGIHGVVPYVAPEVLMGKECTQAADIYSFGVIMPEISTGRRAFDGESFNDTKFAKRICQGKRPEFDKKTPECYVKLAERCMDRDQNKRPTATDIAHMIGCWLYEMKQDDNENKKQFLEADKFKPNIELPKHSNHMYTSKLIKTGEISRLSEIPDDQ
jgi:serine/threonine protein kinase